MDFTFGTFNFTNEAYPGTRVNTTSYQQLALFVVIYSLINGLGFTRKQQRHQSVRFPLKMYLPARIKLMVMPEIGDYSVFALGRIITPAIGM
ncbi:hypothetical protein NXX61_26520 [Bacteroides ovatus]|nr:hypothetical protein [Bacteroides ovatus]